MNIRLFHLEAVTLEKRYCYSVDTLGDKGTFNKSLKTVTDSLSAAGLSNAIYMR